jgi:amicyanin
MGCSGGGTTNSPTTTAPAGGNAVTMSNFSFSPATLTVSAGATVTWTNRDSVTHTVVSDTGVFDSGNMGRNASFSHTFDIAGTYTYHCGPHPYMKGTIVVR